MGKNKLPHNIFTHLDLKIFSPENKSWRPSRVKAPAGKCYSIEGMQAVLSITLMELERIFKDDLYKIVQVGPNSANFVWERKLTDDEKEVRQRVLAAREAQLKGEPPPPVPEQKWQPMPGQKAWDNRNNHWVNVLDAYVENGKITKYSVEPEHQQGITYEVPVEGLDKDEPCQKSTSTSDKPSLRLVKGASTSPATKKTVRSTKKKQIKPDSTSID